MKTIFVHHRSTHHAKNSGYARLIDFINGEIIPSEIESLPYSLRKYVANFISNKYGFYDTQSIEKEWQLLKKIKHLEGKPTIVHYLNGERDIRFTPMFYKKNVSFTATFHKPPEVISQYIKNNIYLKKLDGVVAVGPNQVTFLKNWLDLDKVTFIPHGVDINFFQPLENKEPGKRLLFVGQHMRDFTALNYGLTEILKRMPGVKFQIVIRKEFVKNIKNLNDSIEIFMGISDKKLRSLYQNASLLFLPLLNSTACNSILEALACGLPIVTTDIGGNRGYVDETCSVMASPKDYSGLVNGSIFFLENPNILLEMGKAARLKAVEFSWENIACQINKFHSEFQ